jgi:hypothetical protein
MPELNGRDLHLVKKALAIATLAIERRPGPFQSTSDQADMKDLLDRMIESDVELEYYARAAVRTQVKVVRTSRNGRLLREKRFLEALEPARTEGAAGVAGRELGPA